MTETENERQLLSEGLTQIQGEPPATVVVDQLLQYLQRLRLWNRRFNLISRGDEEKLVSRHLLDSLTLLPFIDRQPIIDLGSGAGLPGIPLAICRPELSITLLDSNGKKTRFLTQIKTELHLAQLQVVHARMEQYRPTVAFNLLLSRAVGEVATLIEQSQQLAAPTARYLFLKGSYPQHELERIPPSHQVVAVETLKVPGLSATRHLVIVQQQRTETSKASR